MFLVESRTGFGVVNLISRGFFFLLFLFFFVLGFGAEMWILNNFYREISV